VIVADFHLKYPREGDRFIMQVLIKLGYSREKLRILNQVRVSQQLLFLSDILTASGLKINPEVMHPHPPVETWSKMCWPNKQPTMSNFQLWRSAMQAICPSWGIGAWVGCFVTAPHKIWRWTWDSKSEELHRLRDDGETVNVFASGGKPNRFHFSRRQLRSNTTTLCLVEPTHAGGGWRLTSSVCAPDPPRTPRTFLEVLRSWGNTWLWANLSILGGADWIQDAVSEGTLVAVTDGSYIRELYPNLCSAAFVLECAKGRGRMIGSFSESLMVANG
jgi:hypothetical protein